jgi:tryptophan halogenase
MAATALAKAVKLGDWSICVVCDDAAVSLAPYDVADATLPLPRSCHAALELDEDQLVARIGGSFTYGIALAGWSDPAATYFHPFGSVGAGLGPVAFHHLAMRLRQEGFPLRLANYSLAALAAQAGRFCRPAQDPRSVLSTCQYGLHVDCVQLAELLRAEAEALGVARVPEALRSVERADDGTITAIRTAGAARVEGDLFLDCTGSEARLMDDSGDAGWVDWSSWLPCSSVVSARTGSRHSPPPYSLAAADSAGWVRHLPMQGRTWLVGFHDPAYSSTEEVVDALRKSAQTDLEDVRQGALRFGRRTEAWQGNCLALGGAAVLIDPLATTNLQLLRTAIDRLLRLLPAERSARVEALEYNRLTALQLDNARDFAALHYKLNGRHGEPFWDARRAMSVPETLEYKMRSYESRGRVAMYDEEPLEEVSWLNLFDEHGVRPRRYSPLADGFTLAELRAHVGRVRTIMLEELASMPLHADYLSRLQGARPAGVSA